MLVLFAAGCGGGGGNGGDGGVDTIVAPTASAGANQNVATGSLVTLDGSESSDPQGDLLSYYWIITSMPAGSTAALSQTTAAKPTFTADVDGTYTIVLVVSDGVDESAEASVTITATTANAAPVANAGVDQSVAIGRTVTLDGSTSYDADYDEITYTWALTSKPAGSAAVVSDTKVAKPVFLADVAGDYIFSLVVNDGTVDSAADTVKVSANTVNTPPVANAGPDQSVVALSKVTLDGAASYDADGDAITYLWTFVSKPPTSPAVLSNATSIKPSFDANIAGDYVLRLVVNDGIENSVADTITVTATSVIDNAKPVADAGADQNAAVTETVTLDGSGSSDADLDPLTYSWSFLSKPAGSTATLSDPTAVTPTFYVDVSGEYVVQLVVNDGKLNSSADSVTIRALSPNVKWVVTTTVGGVDYGPTVGPDDQIYVPSAGIYSINPDGTEKWYNPSAIITAQEKRPRSRVCIGPNDHVYAGFDNGKLHGITKSWGTFSVAISTGGTLFSDVIEDNGYVYFGSDDGKLYVVTTTYTPSVVWTYQTGAQVGTPAIAADGTVYVGSKDNKFYALNADGTLKWSVDFAGGGIGEPAVGSDGTIYVTGYYSGTTKKELVAFNPDGSLQLTFLVTPSIGGAPVVAADGTIYAVSENSSLGGLYAVNADGSQKWVFETGVQDHASPVLTASGSILLSVGNSLYSVSSAGTENWEMTSSTDFSGAIIGEPAVGSDGTIFIGTTMNKIYALYGG